MEVDKINIKEVRGVWEKEVVEKGVIKSKHGSAQIIYYIKDIYIKQAEEREEITAAASNGLHFYITEFQDATIIHIF